jgi:hypothetical protein
LRRAMERTIRVQYYCNSHGCMTIRRGRFVRTFRSRRGRQVLLYFDLRRNNFRHAVDFTILRSSKRTIRKPVRFRDA